MIQLQRGVLILLLLLAFIMVGVLTVGAEGWTEYQADDRATGYVDGEAVRENVTETWTHETGLGVVSSPVVTEESVYFGKLSESNLWRFSPQRRDLTAEMDTTGEFVSINRATGKENWAVETNGSVLYTSPAVHDGRAYIASGAGTVYSVDKQSGEVVWEYDVDYPFFASPKLYNGTVYVGARSYNAHTLSHESFPFLALDAEDGSLVWEFEVEEGIFGAAGIDREEEAVYVGGQNGSVFKLDAASGEVRWEFETDSISDDATTWRTSSDAAQSGGVASGPTLYDDRVYFGSYAGDLYSVNASTGEQVWQQTAREPFVTSPAIENGTLYIGGYDGQIHAVDTEDGEYVWQFQGEWEIAKSSPILVNDTVYAGSIDGEFYAVDAETGDEVWTYSTGTFVDSSPAYHDGTLYFTSFEALHALEEAEDGLEPDGLEYGGVDDRGEEETEEDQYDGEYRRETAGGTLTVGGVTVPSRMVLVVGFAVAWFAGMGLVAARRY